MEQQGGPVDEKGLGRGSLPVFLLFSCFLLLIGCSGGGNSASPRVGTASGKLIVPPDNTVEAEPNDTPAQAQAVSGTLTIAGAAAQDDPGFVLSGEGAKIEDLYRLSAPSGKVRITLSIAANDLNANDLDLFLLDGAGNVIDSSEGSVGTEMVETAGPGDFLVGVRAFKGSSAYVLNFTPLGA
ncbi:MAG TPA: PPC domain-containing protein, partial [Candidatus Manganitrophaceae bacterium]|nr:PPC domain-containing protein [Candidatus Manganitrophaceae bacterium]